MFGDTNDEGEKKYYLKRTKGDTKRAPTSSTVEMVNQL